MQAKAKLNHMMMSARKVRQVADELREKTVDQALNFLTVMRDRKKAALPLEKILKSAVANMATVSPNVDTEKVFVKEVCVDSASSFKRIRARAQGRAYRRLKRTCHISIVISD